jgi:hypothetical protein
VQPVTEPPTDGDLHPLWLQISAALLATGRAVFPAVPDITTAAVSWPGASDSAWAQFLAVAQGADAAVLYAQAEALPPVPAGVRAAGTDVADQFPGRAGQVGEIELAFSVEGVVHYWSASTDWWGEVMNAADRARRDDQSARHRRRLHSSEDEEYDYDSDSGGLAWIDWNTPSGEAEVEQALGADTLTAAVERVSQHSAFLHEGSGYTRRSAMVDSPEGDAELRAWWDAVDADALRPAKRAAVEIVLRRAAEVAEQARRAKVAAALADMDSLVPELQAFPGWAQARLAPERRRRIREFVVAHLGFVSADLADRLYTAVKEADK